jgi:hypothetical protein
MKNIVISILLFSYATLTSAEYTVQIPLEQNNGGGLPVNSIIMTNWLPTSPTFTAWTNTNELYNCTNWSPNENTVTINQNFVQTATDCKQEQNRLRQEREYEDSKLAYRNVGEPISETRIIDVIDTRDAIGTLETWIATNSTYTSWSNSSVIYGCNNWSPDPSTITTGQTFIQTATDCEQDQTRNRQDREQETTTLLVRNSGAVVVENQIITVNNTRNSVGTKETWVATTATYSSWVNSGGGIYGCNNWSPDPSTVTTGQTFTQTATDCEQDQTRNRQNREQETTTLSIRNSGAVVVENQIITVSNTRSATGTKVVTPDCRYTFNVYHWITGTTSGLLWSGAMSIGGYPAHLTSYDSGGYRYSRGAKTGGASYQICRIPL